MKTWYQEVTDDLGVDLIQVRKDLNVGITDHALRDYKNNGIIPRNNSKKCDILNIIQSVKPEYTMDDLEKLWKQYQVKSSYKDCTRNIKDALQLIQDNGIKITVPISLKSNKPDKVSQWIMKEIQQPEGLANIGRLLQDIRGEVKVIEDIVAVKNLHDAITPLVVASMSCVDLAREKLLGIDGVDDKTGPVAAALAISLNRGKAQTLSVEADEDGFYHFKTPENAIVEKTFGIEEEDLKQRIGNRLMPLLDLREPNQKDIELSEKHYKKIQMHTQRSHLSAHPPYIYIEDDGSYPEDQLEEATNFSGIHRFSSEAEKVKVFHDEFALDWLLRMYGSLYKKEKELNPIEQLRKKLQSLPNTEQNKDLEQLQVEAKNMSDSEFLSRAEKITTILSNSSQVAANIPEAMVNATTAFEKSTVLLSYLSELIPSVGT